MRFHRGGIDRQDIGTRRFECLLVRLKGGELTVSAGRVVLGIEYQYGIFLFPLGKSHPPPPRTVQREIRRHIAHVQHTGTPQIS